MDPLSALSLACGILQVIDFSSKFISGATEVYLSTSGTTIKFEDSDKAAQSLRNLTRRLDVRSTGGPLSSEERCLLGIKHGCEELSQEIQGIISSATTRKRGSRRASFLVSWRALKHKGKLKTLEERLGQYRAQAQEYLLATIRCSLTPDSPKYQRPLLT